MAEAPTLQMHLKNAKYDTRVNRITGYSANVKSLWGKNYLLLGNAGEFLDPVFSSGVTIALKSASLASGLLHRHFQGESINWQNEYATPLQKGINTFRTYVEAWYDGSFQDVIFYDKPIEKIKEMICSILAGYAWDESNPFVSQSKRRLAAVAEICKGAAGF